MLPSDGLDSIDHSSHHHQRWELGKNVSFDLCTGGVRVSARPRLAAGEESPVVLVHLPDGLSRCFAFCTCLAWADSPRERSQKPRPAAEQMDPQAQVSRSSSMELKSKNAEVELLAEHAGQHRQQ